MKMCGMVVQVHAYTTSALDGGEWLASFPSHFTLGERIPSLHYLSLGESHSQSECCGEEKNLLPLPGIKSQFPKLIAQIFYNITLTIR
jgi:hypothetical protein